MRFCLPVLILLAPSTAFAADSFHFENDILPILARYGCNSSGCHGKAEGQGGFKLSVFASDPEADYAALTKEGRGRRVFPAKPEESLILRKGSGRTAHGGGTKLPFGGEDYRTLRDWIGAGMPLGSPDAPRVVSLRVEPAERVMNPKSKQQLKVFAKYTNGSEKDVTRHARFQTNAEAVAGVSASGMVSTHDVPGEAAVMAAYLGEVGLFRVMVPRPRERVKNTLPQFNVIDKLVDAKLAKLNIAPSELCDDADFLRRIFLDLTGTLPTPEEARKFLADTAKDKRAKLVESLLEKSEFADLWAMRWADLLRVDRQPLGHQRAYLYYKWIRDSIATNKPFDQFARELITAEGPPTEVGPVNFFKVVTKPGEMAGTLSQVFLGVRIACAECHHHPFDRWKQSDYFGMTAFFSTGTTTHPRTRKPVFAHALGTEMPTANPVGDRRIPLAEWMTKPDNPYFARNLANRVWAWMLGRGLVEPVDDVRATNPPSNPELLDALAKFLVENKFDVKKLIVLIASSRAYQTSVTPNATNEKDERNFSRGYFKRPDAEVLLDMICQALGVEEKFAGSPDAKRAVQLWDSKARHDFLKLFGRPSRVSACECERTREPSVSQVLNLLNSLEIQAKLTHEGGTVARLVRDIKDDGKLVEELYLTFFARLPTTNEKAIGLAHLKKYANNRRAATENLAWALLNSTEFLFNH
ncbi:MAG: PSD1 and planctomycete cytochrome C domain-containing protein [Planctomycetia bacterium]|nr:PSD1 and planctomycete cytochrome C domain-containing protein [Planctomycetia bacterium]